MSLDHTNRTTQEVRDEFSIECQNNVESTSQKGFHFLCSVDGSEISHLGFDLFLSLRKKYDYITIFHAFKQNQSDLPEIFQANTIRQKYESELGRHISSSQSQLIWEARYDRSVVDVMNDCIRECNNRENPPNFIILGHIGRKLGKGNKEKEYFAPLSSNCDRVLRTIQLPCFIAKRQITSKRQGKEWAMAVDGTIYSNRGLDILLSLVRSRDIVHLFYIYNDTESEEHLNFMKIHYENDLQEYGPVTTSFSLIRQDLGKDLQHALTDYVNQLNPDIFVLSPRARSTLTLSPITDYVINNVVSSILVCKN